MEKFSASLGLRDALELYLFLEAKEDELPSSASSLRSALRSYLYEHLSIEEMESPRALLDRLN
jgi:hypothetical protein